jgi:hypothetical protein
MSDIKVPPIGTRVEVLSRYTLEWMNQYRRPTIGIVAHSNPWDKPGTFRLVEIEGPFKQHYESNIKLDALEYLKVLGTSRDPENPDAANVPDPRNARSFEIKGSKDNLYIVTIDGEKSSCTCSAGQFGRMCKHVKAARELAAA